MHLPSALAPFPWHALAHHDGAVLAAVRDARRAVEAAVDPDRAAEVLTDLLGVRCEFTVHRIRPAPVPRDAPRLRVVTRLSDGSASVAVDLDPGLVTAAVARLLGRQSGIEAPRAPIDAHLVGAAEALLLELFRRLSGDGAVAVELSDTIESGPGVALDGSVRIDGRGYGFGAFVRWHRTSSLHFDSAVVARRLGALPIRLPLVIGECRGTWRELSELLPGDAWACGGGIWLDRAGAGEGALAAPLATRGPRVAMASDGGVVLVGGAKALALDVEEADVEDRTRSGDDPVTEAIYDAPVVVRVELGSVSMAAREWVELRPGDVIRTDRRIASPAILRVAGREVATGELVEVDGDLGVRILSLSADGSGS